ncbi:MAG: metallophosphoesterase [Actinomycetota bacterium]
MSFVLPFTHLADVEVFSVEDTSAQITWHHLPDGELGAIVHHHDGPRAVVLGDAGRPGAADITGLLSGASTVVDITVDQRPVAQRLITTEPRLDTPKLTKIATISDLHLGETRFGVIRKFRESTDRQPYALRCAIAAAREAQAWGAELLVIKGDITDLGYAHEWELFDQLLAETDIPVLAVPGNHDTVGKSNSLDATEQLQARGLFPSPVHHVDVDGARIVLADSTVPTHSYGRLNRWRDELVAAVAVDRPAMVFTHHHLEDRAYPWFWPLGIQRFDNAGLVKALSTANPDLVISSGHTHRNRVRHEGSAVISEVSATKDYPGVWAGYVLHENGVRQAVRRIAEPSCVSWNDRTHAVVAGIWGAWSPGRISDRAFTHTWSVDRRTEPVGEPRRQSASLSGASDSV